jgi:beta-phosphoglucomutase
MLKAVIFDFDGVIADSEQLHYKALNQAFATRGLHIPKEVHWQKYLGFNDLENVVAVNKDYKMNWSRQEINLLIELKAANFHALARTEAPIIDGVEDFIEMLHTTGLPLAICSGATREDIEIMLEHSEIKNAFKTIITANDVDKGKPDPEGYLLALQRLKEKTKTAIEPAQCVVIEDSGWGLQAAIAAGMHTVAVTNSYPADHLSTHADYVIDHLDMLTIDDLKRICRESATTN